MNPVLHYSATLENPYHKDKISLYERIKSAMIAEGTLIANNLKAVFAFLSITGFAVVDAVATEPSPIREWTLTTALIIAIGYLVRSLALKDKEIKELYRKLLDRNKDDEDEEPQKKGVRRK